MKKTEIQKLLEVMKALRDPKKGKGRQVIHTDWKPRNKKSEKFAGIVCMIYLDNSYKNNGATRIIPKTHQKIGWPDIYIDIKKKHIAQVKGYGQADKDLIVGEIKIIDVK